MITLVMENANEDLLEAIKSMAKVANVKINVKKESPLNKFEKSILRASKQVEKDRKNGTLKYYQTAEEMHKDILK